MHFCQPVDGSSNRGMRGMSPTWAGTPQSPSRGMRLSRRVGDSAAIPVSASSPGKGLGLGLGLGLQVSASSIGIGP